MLRYLDIITTVSSVMLIRSGTEENLNKKKDLWKYIKNADINIYSKLRLGILGRGSQSSGSRQEEILIIAVYHVAQKFYGFN